MPGRSLYLKMNEFLNFASRTRSIVFGKLSSVSPQKPTMKSELTATPGTLSRHRASMSV